MNKLLLVIALIAPVALFHAIKPNPIDIKETVSYQIERELFKNNRYDQMNPIEK